MKRGTASLQKLSSKKAFSNVKAVVFYKELYLLIFLFVVLTCVKLSNGISIPADDDDNQETDEQRCRKV